MLGFTEDDGFLVTQFFMQAPDLFNVVAADWDVLGPFSLFQMHHTDITELDRQVAWEILEGSRRNNDPRPVAKVKEN